MKVFITKWVFTKGIVEMEGIRSTVSPQMISVPPSPECYFGTYFHGQGRDWHLDRESAIKRAREMQAAKIKSLEKQIQKIRDIQFV